VGGTCVVPNTSMFDLISNILRLLCGVSRYVAGNGSIAPTDPMGPGLKLVPADARAPGVVFVP
jgi:hypothetical protein